MAGPPAAAAAVTQPEPKKKKKQVGGFFGTENQSQSGVKNVNPESGKRGTFLGGG